MDIERFNNQLKNEFYEHRDYLSLEKYVMSELLSPIQDYNNFVSLIRDNIDIVQGPDLLFIACYLNSEYSMNEDMFLVKLENMAEQLNAKDKSIIYYLKAYDIICKNKDWKADKLCFLYLQKSVELSNDINFANNRYYLAQYLNSSELAQNALENINQVETIETLKNKDLSYWLSTVYFINEFILGISANNIVYKQKKEKLTKLELL